MILRKARERCQMSQPEFGRALGEVLGRPISPSQISDWERGRNPPAGAVLLAAAKLAGGSLDELRATALRGGAGGSEEEVELSEGSQDPPSPTHQRGLAEAISVGSLDEQLTQLTLVVASLHRIVETQQKVLQRLLLEKAGTNEDAGSAWAELRREFEAAQRRSSAEQQRAGSPFQLIAPYTE